MSFDKKLLAAAIVLAFPALSHAEEPYRLPDVTVTAPQGRGFTPYAVSEGDLVSGRAATSDTASLLKDVPGVSLYGAGGVSSLPAIHGMADDRLRIQVDGMNLISACANHMNPPLSYIDPTNVGSAKVFAGITPVSVGGDSIGGTIQVNSPEPEFAAAGQGSLLKGQAGVFYRSNGNAYGGNVSATVASEKVSVTYAGSTVKSDNYKAGGDFKAAGPAFTGASKYLAADEVGSSSYKSENQSVRFALRQDNHLVELKLGFQNIPYQGFPNQRMDMTSNDSQQVNLRYKGQYRWGALEARVYDERTRHKMNFLEDKQFWYPNSAPGMPMDTDGKNTGATVKADIALTGRDILRVGGEYQRYRLNDWWDPSGTGGMSPNTFWNINNGQRDRFDLFAEWEARWSQQWVSQLGIRSDTVKMDTGTVQGYKTGNPYGTVAAAFNALDRQRTDNNVDLTALARYTPDDGKTFEFGYARKTRSPNLYERYTWSTGSTMVLNMNNWFGDGNGYVGNVNLKPEEAHTLSATGSWHDAAQSEWELKVSPYYTRVENYIDAVACTACVARTDGFVNLTFANQTARIYGVDISGYMPLAKSDRFGSFTATGALNYVRGKNLTTGDNLYNMMPLNAKLAVVQRLSGWTNTAELQMVDAKTDVQAVRKEIKTGGYGLLNLRSSYDWKKVRLDVGIDNVFNKFYYTPLGGAYVGQGATMGTGVPHGVLVPGMGRSIYTGLTVKF